MPFEVREDELILPDREYFSFVRPIGEGSHSYIYRFRIHRDIYALKLYNGCYEESLEKIEEKMRINIDSYINPKKILYIRNQFAGYLMKLCKGKDLEQRRIDITINEFAEKTVKLMKDTKELTNLKYAIYDAFISNIMYDDGFKMIDMDDYFYLPNESLDYIETKNIERLNKALCKIFIKNSNLSKFYFNNVEFQKLIYKCEKGELLFEDLFNKVCMEAFNMADMEIEKISDVGKVLSKYKKM